MLRTHLHGRVIVSSPSRAVPHGSRVSRLSLLDDYVSMTEWRSCRKCRNTNHDGFEEKSNHDIRHFRDNISAGGERPQTPVWLSQVTRLFSWVIWDRQLVELLFHCIVVVEPAHQLILSHASTWTYARWCSIEDKFQCLFCERSVFVKLSPKTTGTDNWRTFLLSTGERERLWTNISELSEVLSVACIWCASVVLRSEKETRCKVRFDRAN